MWISEEAVLTIEGAASVKALKRVWDWSFPETR